MLGHREIWHDVPVSPRPGVSRLPPGISRLPFSERWRGMNAVSAFRKM
jgi:hypothetical protein